jgi:DNA-binding protein H-NS
MNHPVLNMKRHDIESMSVDELCSLHEFVAISPQTISRKITACQLDLGSVPENVKDMSRARRPYPQVVPKYRNSAEPSETWSGRGKQPCWLTAQLRSGNGSRISGFSPRLIVARLRKIMSL